MFIKKILKRFFFCCLALLLLSVAVFYLSRLAPGDPLQSFYGDAVESMSIEELSAARTRLGLDGPIHIQYLKWLKNAFSGEFGISLKYKMPALDVMKPLIGNTLILGVSSFVLTFLIAILIAMLCAVTEGSKLEKTICKIGTAFYYIPPFWMGVVLILFFSIRYKIFPMSGAYDIGKENDIFNRIEHLILPLTIMVLSHFWYYASLIRSRLLDETRKDYVLLAKTKGLTKWQIVWKHCFINVLPSILGIMAVSVPHVISGTYLVEAVFEYPGLGNLAVTSAKYHDYNLLMLLVLLTGAVVLFTSFLTEVFREKMDPRLRQNRN